MDISISAAKLVKKFHSHTQNCQYFLYFCKKQRKINNMTHKYIIEYNTRWGENIAMLACLKAEQDKPFHYADPQIIPFSTSDGKTWSVAIDLPSGSQYRYCVIQDDIIIRTEVGCLPHTVTITDNQNTIIDHWQEPDRMAGVAIPLFSLRSTGSQGVGDMGDLHMFVDWVASCHLRVIQILPINDTTTDGSWQDSYPYNSISCHALHPMYLDLRQLPQLHTKEADKILQELTNLNALPQLDYEQVNRLKRRYILLTFKRNGAKTLQSKSCQQFIEANEEWLTPYVKFRTNHPTINGSVPELYIYTQYLLHLQLLSVSEYAKSQGVILKGDIPIGVNRDGVEVQTYPELFHQDNQTGAPPDTFSSDGQNWGFPTYNWERMADDGYHWWKRRMQHLSLYFSAYRIDHLLGFFRIWEIPMPEKSGLMGHFSPALPMSREEIGRWEDNDRIMTLFIEDPRQLGYFHPNIGAKDLPAYHALNPAERAAFDRLYEHFFYRRHTQFWYDEAMKKLPALTSSNLMICCGEDLGMIPECVPWVMNRLRILSLEIQNMPKKFGVEFGDPTRNPVLSVCTISSHDTPTFRGWWEEQHESAQHYYNSVLHLLGTAPQEAPSWLCERVIRQHLASPSCLCILTLQDWLAMDDRLRNPDAKSERINIPANPRHYWRWRMHLTIEELIQSTEFTFHIAALTDESKR